MPSFKDLTPARAAGFTSVALVGLTILRAAVEAGSLRGFHALLCYHGVSLFGILFSAVMALELLLPAGSAYERGAAAVRRFYGWHLVGFLVLLAGYVATYKVLPAIVLFALS